MTNLIPFNFNNHNVRVLEQEGEAWFVARDICEALGITWQGKRTLAILPKEWTRVVNFTTEAGARKLNTQMNKVKNNHASK